MVTLDAKNIVAVVALVFSIIVAGLLGGILVLGPQDSTAFYRPQFVDGVVYGYMIINAVHVLSIFAFNKQLAKETRLVFVILGIVLWLTAAGLMFEVVNYYHSNAYSRLMTAGIFSIFECVIYSLDAFFTYKSTE